MISTRAHATCGQKQSDSILRADSSSRVPGSSDAALDPGVAGFHADIPSYLPVKPTLWRSRCPIAAGIAVYQSTSAADAGAMRWIEAPVAIRRDVQPSIRQGNISMTRAKKNRKRKSTRRKKA
jgi:hypothetical protein